MSSSSPSSIVYSCTFADYDETLGPFARTPNTQFLRFGTSKPNRRRIWQHMPVPHQLQMETQTLTNRRFKLFPGDVLPECDVAIYVDGNILIRADLSPLIEAFWNSGADIALFPHPSGRTLENEIDFVLERTIPQEHAPLAEMQRQTYGELGILGQKITENTIIFYRMSSPKVAQIGQLWWHELKRYCKRDQISLPYVLNQLAPKVHYWDWHFHHPSEKNIYFARSPHLAKDPGRQFKKRAFFMKDFSTPYWVLATAISMGGKAAKPLKQVLGRRK